MKYSLLLLMLSSFPVLADASLPTVRWSVAGTPLRATALLVHPDELSDVWIDRAARLGLTTLAIHPCGGAHADLSLADLLARCRTPEFRRLIDRAWNAGVRVEYEAHVGGWLVPRDLFASKPDCFRMNKSGMRTNDFNFCVSNPEAMRIAEERVRTLVGGFYRSTPRYFFWLDDAPNAACHCERCRTLSASDQQLLVLNRLLTVMRQDKPESKLAYLAYLTTMTPPMKIRPADGVFLEYAPIKRVWDRRVEDQPNAVKPEEIGALLDFFGRKDARVLEYWFDNSLFSKWKKPEKKFVPQADVFASDVAWYAARGFGEIASFACFLGPGYERQWGTPDVSPMTVDSAVSLRGLYSSQGGRDATAAEVRLDRDGRLRFSFKVKDETPTRIPAYKGESDVDAVDRVELYLSPTGDLTKRYYCLVVTPEGRVHDYAAESYRRLDASWTCQSLKVACMFTADGYEVSGSVDWAELEALGLTRTNIHLGVFRADFRDGGKLVSWLSALPIDASPDFHRPGSLFRF